MLTQDELRKFYRSFSGKREQPLEPDDPCYVPLFEESTDPIRELWQRIDWVESESVHLLTGYRGNGKSTELKRLKRLLETESNSECTVFLVDMLEYVFPTKPIYISDFIVSLMSALEHAAGNITTGGIIGSFFTDRWKRFINFLNTEIKLETFNIKLSPVELGGILKTDQIFKERIRECFAGRITKLIDEAGVFVADLVEKIQNSNPEQKVVLLVDSLEQLRGEGEDAKLLYDSVLELFSGQARNLHFHKLHIVYTIPPFLPALAQNPGKALGGNPVTRWPNIHVRNKEGEPDIDGLKMMESLVEKCYAAWKDVIPLNFLHKVAMCSGGDIRDFFRLVREPAVILANAIVHNKNAQFDEQIAVRVIQDFKNSFLLIAEKDAKWLAKIHKSKKESLEDIDLIQDLARFLDNNLIMSYRNGEDWVDVHPLIVEEINRISQENG